MIYYNVLFVYYIIIIHVHIYIYIYVLRAYDDRA